jgi:copper chaperone CopZ
MKAALILSAIFMAVFLNARLKQDTGASEQKREAVQSSIRTLRVGLAGLQVSTAKHIEQVIRNTPGVQNVHLDVSHRKARIDFDLQKASASDVVKSLREARVSVWFE